MDLMGPPRRKKSARFVEIAAAAGVSTATVNRVLNESGSVSAPTRAKVVAAAKRLGVPRVLPDPRDGLMVALREQVARGVPVMTLMSPIAEVPQLHHAGIDNLSAGRTAGHFIGRLATVPGQVLLLTHSLSFRAHAERMLGCQQVLAQHHPQLAVSAPVECLDDADRCHLAVQRALLAARSNGRPLVAIYHSGAGTGGVASALQQAGTGLPHIAWIGHELSDEHRRWLQQGLLDLVIDQDPDGQIVAGLHHLLHACGYVEQAAPLDRIVR
jgi:LacI family transcriptional regulator